MDKICGQWRIDMLDWWLFGIKLKLPRRFWWWFRNVKLIWENSDGSIQGCNILWGWLKWGRFKVEMVEPQDDYVPAHFMYKYFEDSVEIANGDGCGNLYFRHRIRATFAMTRIVPAIDK